MTPKTPLFSISFLRHLSTKHIIIPTPPSLKNISRGHHRRQALTAARVALIDYLHFTRSLPFSLSDQIISNSPSSLSSFLSLIPFPSDATPSDYPSFIRRFLSYHPIDEIEFFSESIGLHPPSSIGGSKSPFLSDNLGLVQTALMLVRFGFPFQKLGLLHQVLKQDENELIPRLNLLEALGLRRVLVIGACLAFPWVLKSNVGEKAKLLFEDLSSILLDYEMNDVDFVFEMCRKVSLFYDSGVEIGKMGEVMGNNRRVFLQVKEEDLRRNLDFFVKLGMRKKDMGIFVLSFVDIFNIELKSMEIVVPDVLVKLLSLDEDEIEKIGKMYPHVMGRNVAGNLLGVLKALDLDRRLIDKITNMDFHCLKVFCNEVNFNSCVDDNDREEEDFLENMKVIKSRQKVEYLDNKLDFLYSIGFGRNKITSKIVSVLKGPIDQLQERFDCLIRFGIEYSNVCKMISGTPTLLNQSTDSIRKKANYLCDELGYPLDFLIDCPFYLCFDLEKRIKPRYDIMNWLKEIGFVKKTISPATILSNDEKRFIIYLYKIHPAAPKQWLETFSSRNRVTSNKTTWKLHQVRHNGIGTSYFFFKKQPLFLIAELHCMMNKNELLRISKHST